MSEYFEKAKWEALQSLNDDDVMEAIAGSVAIPLAIKQGDWQDAMQLLAKRIETKTIRQAEFATHGFVKTNWIDEDDELRELRNIWILRDATAMALAKERQAKMDAQFQQMFDE